MTSVRAGWAGLVILAGCGDAGPPAPASAAPSTGSAPATAPTDARALPSSTSASAPGPSAGTAAAAPSGAVTTENAKPIATWLLESAARTKDRTMPFALEGVYRRTSLHQSGHFVGGEHPGHRTLVVYVADSLDAQPIDTLECWTDLLTMPADLREGDRVRVEGQLDHAVGGPRMYLPYLGSCKYTRL